MEFIAESIRDGILLTVVLLALLSGGTPDLMREANRQMRLLVLSERYPDLDIYNSKSDYRRARLRSYSPLWIIRVFRSDVNAIEAALDATVAECMMTSEEDT